MNITCYIIDDEPLAIEVIESHIEKVDSITIAGTFRNAIKAFQALRDEPVDLLLLDIQMPRLSGIEFLKTLKNPPLVIFTTAYREYALEGFELDVVDYLLKPISFERFLKAVDKVMEQLQSSNRSQALPAGEEEEDHSKDHLFVPSNRKYVKICLNDILFVESKRDYVLIKTKNKEVLTNQTITYMEEKLPSGQFLRIHRSFIINLSKIESWSQTEVDLPSRQIPIGRTYKNQTMKELRRHSEMI